MKQSGPRGFHVVPLELIKRGKREDGLRNRHRLKPFTEQAIECAMAAQERVASPAELPEVLRTVVIVVAAQGVIDNGGLQYFFEMDFPNTPPYALFIEAYRKLGALAEASAFEQAVALFPFPEPHLALQRRNDFLDQLKDDAGDAQGPGSPLEPFTDVLCGNDQVWICLERYIEAHADHFPGVDAHAGG